MSVMQRVSKASLDDINQLKKLVKRVERVEAQASEEAPQAIREPPLLKPKKILNIFDNIANVEVTREALQIDNPVQLLLILMPELTPYKWQFEMLMMMAGYLTPGDFKTKYKISIEEPFKLVASCANGSGKDMILIAAFAVWYALTAPRNRVIITSASFEQLKSQTEVHIKELANRANKKFGPLFKFTQFHYVVPELGSEIKLFVTDESGRAEGWHPFVGGNMALIMNEAKTINEKIFDAISRCTGYSHWLEVSSPAGRSGHMYRMASNAIQYPNQAVLGKFYFRRVTAFECPHLPKSHIQAIVFDKGENHPLVRSSIYAEFSDYDEPVVITNYAYEKCEKAKIPLEGNDIGIGLDLAGGGDEDVIFVRKGNKVIHFYAFCQRDTDLAVLTIDKQLSPWKDTDYIFRADNGGLGQAIIDKLVKFGWRIRRTNNQSPANNKREFLNLGAEMYFKIKRLIERCDIILPDIHKLKEQLTSRRFSGEASTQGKFALESKKEARLAGLSSPDRADAFVLCFASYKPNMVVKTTEKPRELITAEQLIILAHRGLLFRRNEPETRGRFTSITGKI